MCFAPQPRTHFQHLNFQKCSEAGVVCAFWFRNVLRATTRALFWHHNFQKWSEPGVFGTFWLGNVLPKVLRTWGVFAFFTCRCASRQSGLQLFISHLARWLRTRFSEPTFRPSGAALVATFLPFRAPTSSFFSFFLFFDLLLFGTSRRKSYHLFYQILVRTMAGILTISLPFAMLDHHLLLH